MQKSCLLSGFKYLQENLDVEQIDVICCVGNHGRNTDKLQFANLTETSYEWFLYEDLRVMCEIMKFDKFKFVNPKSGFVIVRYLARSICLLMVTWGFSYKGGGGIYVPFLRYFGKVAPTFPGLRGFSLGHYHTTLDIKEGSW